MDLPTFELNIDDEIYDETGVFAVSVVSNPAIEREAMFFADEKQIQRFQVEDEDERIISGPLLIADKKIYRNNDTFGEHYIVFTSKTIKKIMQKFFATGRQSAANLEHNELLTLKGVSMYESFQIDREKGIMPPSGYEDLSNGSWFGSFKVHDKDVWKMIKKGEFKGFSVEGTFEYAPTELSADTTDRENELFSEITRELYKLLK